MRYWGAGSGDGAVSGARRKCEGVEQCEVWGGHFDFERRDSCDTDGDAMDKRRFGIARKGWCLRVSDGRGRSGCFGWEYLSVRWDMIPFTVSIA